MSVPAYPDYKDSGVSWLGEVPAHWEVTCLKLACDIFPSNVDKKSVDGEQPVKLCNYTDVYYNDVIEPHSNYMDATASDDQIAKFTLRGGDTIITKDSETPDDIARSAYVPSDMPGVVCGYHLSMVRPNQRAHGAFIKRYFDTASSRAYFHVSANGLTRVGLGQYAVDNAPIALPPVVEQGAIAAFLDRETAKIDALVAEQERLIALLKEKRQAVISHAVTKGLNTDAIMKDSGIEWLGEIPAQWGVVPLKHLGEFNAGAGFPHEDQGIEGEELTFYKVNSLGRADAFDVLGNSEDTISRDTAARLRAFVFPPRTIAFAKIGAALLLGRLRLTDRPACLDNNMMGLTVNAGTSVEFVKHAMSLVRFDYISNPGTVPSLNEGQIANVAIACPPPQEQFEIVRELDGLTGRIDTLSDEAQAAITLLQERRAALISAAVTGKIDVRGLVDAPATAELETV